MASGQASISEPAALGVDVQLKETKPRRKRRPRPRRGSDGILRQGRFWFDEAAAERAVRFFETCLVHVEGEFAGQPFILEPWERDQIIRPLFGWKREDGTRRYRVCYIEVPRKNGKSTLAAGIAIYLTFADREPGAQVFSAAADREQAAIVFELAKRMVESNLELSERAELFRRAIYASFLGASYRVISADARTKHGFNAHGVVFDELHAQPNRNLVDVLKTSTGARRQPLEVYITTAGYERHSICWEMHEYALKVRDAILIDDAFLPVIFAADPEDDWTKPATWRRANPSYGVTIKPEYLAAECKRALEIPGYENTFKRLHLNLWTEQAARWLPLADWDLCAGEVDARELLALYKGMAAYCGLDLSSTSDLTAFVLDVPLPDGRHVWIPRFWMPRDNIAKRVQRDRVPYDLWVREGWIKATEGNVVDYDVVRADINAISTEFNLREIAIDRWNATQITTQLSGDGFVVAMFGQGYASMNAPSKELEKLVLGGKLVHGGHPVLRWMASNVAIEHDDAAGNIKPSKAKSGEKIDGIVAGLMGLARATLATQNGGIDGWLKSPVVVRAPTDPARPR